MRLKSSMEGIPLSSFEFSLLCCVAESEAESTVPELVQYMNGVAGLTVSVRSIGQALSRMEQLCYVNSSIRDLTKDPARFGRMFVKAWTILNPGRDAIKAHREWILR